MALKRDITLNTRYSTHKGLAEEIKLVEPFLHLGFNRANMSGACNCVYVDETIIKDPLDFLSPTQNIYILIITMRNHRKFKRFPVSFHLERRKTNI
jgi:hypothetical protein